MMASSSIRWIRKNRFFIIAMVPLMVLIGSVYVYPVFRAIYLSFSNFSLIRIGSGLEFLGFENYTRFIMRRQGQQVLINTLLFSFSTVSIQVLLGLGMALLINKQVRGRAVVRSLLIIPIMVAPVVVGYMWRWIYNDRNGILNYVLFKLELINMSLNFLSDAQLAMPAVIHAQIWYGLPFSTLILLGGLQSLPKSPYEAALIDGASIFQQFRYVTLPLMRPILMVTLLLGFMISFQAFDLIYILTYGGPGMRTEVINSYGYKIAFRSFEMGYASSIAVTSLVILLIIGGITLLLFKYWEKR